MPGEHAGRLGNRYHYSIKPPLFWYQDSRSYSDILLTLGFPGTTLWDCAATGGTGVVTLTVGVEKGLTEVAQVLKPVL
jgi:hypothetical protein